MRKVGSWVSPQRSESLGSFRNTKDMERRIKGSPFYEEPDGDAPKGRYGGRPIIARDTPINGGVYLGSGQREAIVVDDRKSRYLNGVYQELVATHQREARSSGQDFKASILSAVYQDVRRVLPVDGVRAEEIAARYSRDEKVSLDVFIGDKAGVCRHQALLVGYLLERLKREGLVNGKVSIDRNSVPGRGGHAWVRYENSEGTVFIIDPTLGYCGRLDQIDPKDEGKWFYERPKS